MRRTPMPRHRLIHILGSLSVALLTYSHLQAAGPEAVQFRPDVRLSGDQPFTQAITQREPSMAASPRNPGNVVTLYKDVTSSSGNSAVRVAYTLDGGTTWSLGPFAPLRVEPGSSGDPSVVAGADGTFYFAYLDYT